MVKKSKPSGKAESKAPVKTESRAPVEEEAIASEKEVVNPTPGGIIDFYKFFVGVGILIGIFFIIVGILRYVFHVF
jgi:hypothetical protein